MRQFIRGAFVIARRDFAATVLSKAFILFLLTPLFPLLLGGLFGGIGARVAAQTETPVVAVIASQGEFARLLRSRDQLAPALGRDSLVRLVGYELEADADGQRRRLLASRDPPLRAVLSEGFGEPRLVGSLDSSAIEQVRLILGTARSESLPAIRVTNVQASSGSLDRQRAITAQVSQMLLFFLTILLSGMLLSQLIEEKSNKIIEVIAASVPIDALFVGKLCAMLAASVLGILVWIGGGALLIQLVKHGGVATLPPPAVGWPAFLVLAIAYFATNYLLLGAAFLTIGAQAATVREVQTLSMPLTFAQVLLFGFASTAVGAANSPEGIAAAVFPLSSPMAMIARAAEEPGLWPHLFALAWQALWVAIILRLGAQLFRKTVLKSGPRRTWWRLRRA
ncbi:MAG TPA: ABC transporter permease [Sphingomicrobium sp.]|nr:ABC transporter permease [Sphingomicrobium sp.]